MFEIKPLICTVLDPDFSGEDLHPVTEKKEHKMKSAEKKQTTFFRVTACFLTNYIFPVHPLAISPTR